MCIPCRPSILCLARSASFAGDDKISAVVASSSLLGDQLWEFPKSRYDNDYSCVLPRDTCYDRSWGCLHAQRAFLSHWIITRDLGMFRNLPRLTWGLWHIHKPVFRDFAVRLIDIPRASVIESGSHHGDWGKYIYRETRTRWVKTPNKNHESFAIPI